MYELTGTLDPNPSNAVEPFSTPAPGATITYHQGQPPVAYGACLVKVISLSGYRLEFYPVNLGTEIPSCEPLAVDLWNTRQVWPSEPSSNWSAWTSTNCYLVLLLSTKFIADNPALEAALAQDGGKWPRSASEGFIKQQLLERDVSNRLRALRAKLDENGQKELDELFANILQ